MRHGFFSAAALKKRIIKDIDELPMLPDVVEKARSIIMNPDAGMNELAALIETDQALALKVLKLSNSAFFKRTGSVSSINDAVVILGLNIIYEIIVIASTAKLMTKNLAGYGMKNKDLRLHSLASAVSSKIIAGKYCPELMNNAFTAGLIHDCGKLVMDPYLVDCGNEYKKLTASGMTGITAEHKLLGFDHAELAAVILKKWGFPADIRTAVRYHHKPKSLLSSKSAYLIFLSDQLAKRCFLTEEKKDEILMDDALKKLGVPPGDVNDLMEESKSHVMEVVSLL